MNQPIVFNLINGNEASRLKRLCLSFKLVSTILRLVSIFASLLFASYGSNALAELAYVAQPMTWQNAEVYAQQNYPNGHLVTINDQAENEAVRALVSQSNIESWIGYHDSNVEGEWQWISGESTRYENWLSGEPNDYRVNNPNGEDYVSMKSSGLWNDLSETREQPFIVEYYTTGDFFYQAYKNVGNIASLAEFDFDNQTSFQSGKTFYIGTSIVSETSNFILRYSGQIFSSGENFEFKLNSDDGSNFYINGEMVIFNDGAHSPRTLTTSIYLTSGWHELRLDYHEITGGELVELLYKSSAMSSFEALGGSIIRPGYDQDNDKLSDGSDKLFYAGCSLSNLSNDLITDFRNCNFNGQDFPDGTYRNKVFDGSTFDSTNLSNVTFIDSSFIDADLRGQQLENNGGGVSYSGSVTFINANFTKAKVEKHWPYARFYNVNFSAAFFDTSDSDNYDSSWYCYDGSRFLNSDLVRYEIPSTSGGEQNYRLGVPGTNQYQWDLNSFWDHPCVRDIPTDPASSVAELSNADVNIAPAILMRGLLGLPFDSYAQYSVHDYPISGDDTKASYRNAVSETSPYWEWDLGNYYQLDSIRIYKNPQKALELNDAVVLISDWPFAESPLIQSDFDSTVRYSLNPTAKPYYDIPLNRTLRYIRIQRPVNGTNQFLSFKKLEMFGDFSALNQTSTPEPANFVLPLFESNRPECEAEMFNQTNIDPYFDYLAAAIPDEQGRTYWNNADLSRLIKNNSNYFRSELNGTNFEQAELVGADFRNAEAYGANFRGANLAGADFSNAKIRGADFRGANLTGAKFSAVYAHCAYFSGELPASYYSGVQSYENPEFPMLSALAGNSAYGYARSSSIDLGGIPSKAIDNNPSTSSITAIEQSPWWELDMGAIYVLSNIALDTDHDLATVQKLELFISDWPLPADFNGQEVSGQVYQITNFEIDSNDPSKIKFNTEQTGRFIHVRASADLGELRLKLAEVTASTPIIPSAPSSALPLTDLQSSNLVPNTQALLNSIDSLINQYQRVDVNDGVETAQETLGKLSRLALDTVNSSQKLIKIQQNFRKITRPVDSSVFLVKRLKAIPPLKVSADKFITVMNPVKNKFGIFNKLTHVVQQSVQALNRGALSTVDRVLESSKEITSQVSILKTGRSYIETLQRCALYGTNSDQVRADLESFSLQKISSINTVINNISRGDVRDGIENRATVLQSLNDSYSTPTIQSIHQTSEDVLAFMGPFATAVTPMQLLFDGGEIYDGFTIWDIIDFMADASDFFLGLPGISDVIEFVDGLLSPILDPVLGLATDVVDEVILGPFGDKIEQDRQALIYIKDQLIVLKDNIVGEEYYPIPSVDVAIFSEVMNLSGDSKFASCRDSLNLPPQWPTPDNDDDGDGLSNAFEVGYAPDNITAVTNTLANNPDSDLDGLGDYFEWYWSTQAGVGDTLFIANNGSLNEADRDDDNDGLTAVQEQTYKTNPYKSDTDGDGILDGQEIEWGLNPLSPAGDLSELALDLDGDGLTIAQEILYQLDPIDPLDALEDLDGDGVPDLNEILQGDSPIQASPQQISNLLIEVSIASNNTTNSAAKTVAKTSDLTTIDLTQWFNYSGSGNVQIDIAASNISEGELIISDPNNLNIQYRLNALDLSSRYVSILIKLKTNGGSLVLRLLLKVNFQDSDGDGYNDFIDAFINDPTEWLDTDNDDVGNNADLDDDGDGIPDAYEIANGLDPLVNDALLINGDGITNYQAYLNSLNQGNYSVIKLKNGKVIVLPN